MEDSFQTGTVGRPGGSRRARHREGWYGDSLRAAGCHSKLLVRRGSGHVKVQVTRLRGARSPRAGLDHGSEDPSHRLRNAAGVPAAASSKFPERHGMRSRHGELTATDGAMTGTCGTRTLCGQPALWWLRVHYALSSAHHIIMVEKLGSHLQRGGAVIPARHRRQGTVHLVAFLADGAECSSTLLSLKADTSCCFGSLRSRLDDSQPKHIVRPRSARPAPSQMRSDRQVHHGRPSSCLPTATRPPYDP
jgi:hypothetical protein